MQSEGSTTDLSGEIDEMMLKGIRSMIVLIHIKKGTYPYALLKRFRKSRHPMLHYINKSQLYNILNSLEQKGYVKSRTVLVGSKVHEIYTATPKGSAVARSFSKVFFSFVRRVSPIIRGAFLE